MDECKICGKFTAPGYNHICKETSGGDGLIESGLAWLAWQLTRLIKWTDRQIKKWA